MVYRALRAPAAGRAEKGLEGEKYGEVERAAESRARGVPGDRGKAARPECE